MIHAFDALEPEEETHIYEHAALGFFLFAFSFIPSFMQWFATQDFRHHIAYFRRAVKYLQWQFHDGDAVQNARPWILKYPGYQGCEPMLREFFPDADFVATWRDPVSTLNSTCSLFSAWYQAYSDFNFDTILGQAMLEGQAQRIRLQMDSRREHPGIEILDVSYRELTQSTDRVVRDIYQHAGRTLSDCARESMVAWERDNIQHKRGSHKYSMEQFGLTRNAATEKYRDYIKQYGHLF